MLFFEVSNDLMPNYKIAKMPDVENADNKFSTTFVTV